jgi:hypothetical protein
MSPMGHGPDLKARTDLYEREQKAKIAQQKDRQAPERLDHRHPGGSFPQEKPVGLLTRLWRQLRS